MDKQKATQTDNSPQSIFAELSKVQAELNEMERMRGTNKIEVKKIEERLRSLGEEVIKKVGVWRQGGKRERERDGGNLEQY